MINCRLLLMRFFKLVEYTSLFVNKKYHASALTGKKGGCNMNCQLVDKYLYDYCDNVLSPDQRVLFDQHLHKSHYQCRQKPQEPA